MTIYKEKIVWLVERRSHLDRGTMWHAIKVFQTDFAAMKYVETEHAKEGTRFAAQWNVRPIPFIYVE